MDEVLRKLSEFRILPLVVVDCDEQADELGAVLVTGGLPVAEIAFRTPSAEQSVRTLAKRGDILVGAGTILSIEQADRAIDAGAQFLVAPGTNSRVIEHVLKCGVPIVPGIATPSEIEFAMSLGVNALKFFPAESMGGAAALKAFAGPYPEARFIPTGGITLQLQSNYLALANVLACSGSWLVPRDLLSAGKFDEIVPLLEQAKDVPTARRTMVPNQELRFRLG